MTTYLALLRGINVGKHNRLPMRSLRELLENMGGTDVRTHLQSGNALFGHAEADPAALAAGLKRRISQEFGLTVPCVVRDSAGLRAVMDACPFDASALDPAKLLVTFLSGPVDPEMLKGLDPAAFAPDEFRAGEREIYVHCPEGIRKTRLSHTFWEKRLGLTATARNWNTVTRLAAMANA